MYHVPKTTVALRLLAVKNETKSWQFQNTANKCRLLQSKITSIRIWELNRNSFLQENYHQIKEISGKRNILSKMTNPVLNTIT